MAQFYVLNTTTLGSTKVFAGDLVDDAQDPTVSLAAAGAILWPTNDAIVAAAAALAQARHIARGSNEQECDSIMIAAANASLKGTGHEAAGANLADADATITVAQGRWRKVPAATLGAGRSITLGTTGAVAGDHISITRLDVSANTLAFINGGVGAGTLFTMAVSKLGYANFQFDGTNWALRSFGVQ